MPNRSIHLSSPFFSASRKVYRGIPQGSSLRPTLFNIYTISITYLPSNSTSLFFADDILLFSSSHDIAATNGAFDSSLNSLERALASINFSISPSKSSYIVFTLLPYNPASVSLSLNNTALSHVNYICYLGIFPDSRLSFSKYSNVFFTSIKRLNLLKSLSPTKWDGDPYILTSRYKSIIRSKFDYCSVIYACASRSQLSKLDVIQNSCLRLCLGAPKSSLSLTCYLYLSANLIQAIIFSLNAFPSHLLSFTPTSQFLEIGVFRQGKFLSYLLFLFV